MTNGNWKFGLAGLIAVAALGLICPLLAAPRVPLVDPDEGLHAAIAQEMVERGDWLVPRLFGEPYFERPIFYFWAIAASLKTFGMSEAAVRLPGFLFGMLCTLSTAAIAWRLLGRRTGLLAGLFYASMVLPMALVQLPGYDAPLVTWVNLALLCLWESEGERRKGKGGRMKDEGPFRLPPFAVRLSPWTLAAGMFLGLAILTKGLIGVALVGIAYGGYLIVSRRIRRIHCYRAALALTVAAIIGSWWYIVMARSCPGYLRYYFVGRHLLGFLTNSQPHGMEPWWYYFPVLVVGGMPWLGYLPALVRDAIDRVRSKTPATRHPGYWVPAGCPADASGNRPVLLLGCWFVGCTLFLMLSRSKFATYVWPVFPAIATLAAIAWVRKIDGALSDGARRWMGRIVWSTCLVGPLALPAVFAATRIASPVRYSRPEWMLAVTAGLTSLAPLWSWRRGRDRLTVALAATSVCGQMAVLLFCALPSVAGMLTGRDLADYCNRTRQLPSRLLLAREQVGSVVFYLDPDLRRRLQPGQITEQGIENPLPLPAWDTKEWIVIPERYVRAASRCYDLSEPPFEQAGRFRVYQRNDVEPRARVGQLDDRLLR